MQCVSQTNVASLISRFDHTYEDRRADIQYETKSKKKKERKKDLKVDTATSSRKRIQVERLREKKKQVERIESHINGYMIRINST